MWACPTSYLHLSYHNHSLSLRVHVYSRDVSVHLAQNNYSVAASRHHHYYDRADVQLHSWDGLQIRLLVVLGGFLELIPLHTISITPKCVAEMGEGYCGWLSVVVHRTFWGVYTLKVAHLLSISAILILYHQNSFTSISLSLPLHTIHNTHSDQPEGSQHYYQLHHHRMGPTTSQLQSVLTWRSNRQHTSV